MHPISILSKMLAEEKKGATIIDIANQDEFAKFIAAHPDHKAYHVNDTDGSWRKLMDCIQEGGTVGVGGSIVKINGKEGANPVYHEVIVAGPAK